MSRTHPNPAGDAALGRIAVVGDGRMGRAVVAALAEIGIAAAGPEPRGATGQGADIVLLAVPDHAIAEAAAAIAPGPLVGHLSGALGLAPLTPHESFSIHPLMTVTSAGARFTGVTAALAGSSPRALATAERLAAKLGMSPVAVAPDDRAAYHAAASIAANFLVTVEAFAEQLASTAGIDRAALVPLVRAAVDNWSALGAPAALTGPVARGDDDTVARQRAAIAERAPEQLALFDALVDATRALAERSRTSAAPA